MKIEVGTVARVESKYGALNRAATQAKHGGDLPHAIALLREAKAHQGDCYQDTRLAKFLAHDGQADQALNEIQWLLEKSGHWAQDMFGQKPASVRLRQKTLWQVRIFTDAISICRWIGHADQKAEYERQRSVRLDLLEKIEPVAEADEAKKNAERKSRLKPLQVSQGGTPC